MSGTLRPDALTPRVFACHDGSGITSETPPLLFEKVLSALCFPVWSTNVELAPTAVTVSRFAGAIGSASGGTPHRFAPPNATDS